MTDSTMKTTRTFRIHGAAGHRQAVSFQRSFDLDLSEAPARPCRIHCACSDETGTNAFVDLTITGRNEAEVADELLGQISDGIFENCRVGEVELLIEGESIGIDLFRLAGSVGKQAGCWLLPTDFWFGRE